jgi:hypothetical protein
MKLGEIITVYLNDTPVQLEQIAIGIRQRDATAVGRAPRTA